MGTDVIRLNDKQYIDKMVEQLEAEREVYISLVYNKLLMWQEFIS